MIEQADNLISGLLHLLLRVLDLGQNRPVGKEPVKEIIRNLQKPVDPDLEIGINGDVGQFCLKLAQLGLQLFHKGLRFVQMAVLRKIR